MSVEVNKEELVKQLRENALQKDHVIAEIIVAKDSTNPFCNVSMHGVGLREVGGLYMALDIIKKHIEEQYPGAVKYAKEHLKNKSVTRIDLDN